MFIFFVPGVWAGPMSPQRANSLYMKRLREGPQGFIGTVWFTEPPQGIESGVAQA